MIAPRSIRRAGTQALPATVTLLGVLSLLGACAAGSGHPITAAHVVDRFQERTLRDPALVAFLAAQGRPQRQDGVAWDVDALTLAALFYSPELDEARAQWRQARAAVVTAGERPNPVIGASAGYNTTNPMASPWILTFAADLLLDLTGRRASARAGAAAQVDAARFHVASVAWQVRSRVRAALLDIYAARRTAKQLDGLVEVQRSGVATAEAMLRLGGISPYEVSQAHIALNATLNQAGVARVRESDATATLARAVGVTPDALRAVGLDLSAFDSLPDAIPPVTARRAALLNRADLLEAIAGYAAADDAVGLAVAGRLGDFRVSPGYEFDQGDDKWQLGLGVALPIFNRNEGPIGEAAARRDAARARVDAVQADAISGLDGAIAAYRVARRQVADGIAAQADFSHQLTVAKARVVSGEASRFELLQRTQEIATAAVAQVTALVAAQAALGRVEDAMQQPSSALPITTTSPRRLAQP